MKLLLMLEDDRDRIDRFQAIVHRHYPAAKMMIARTVSDFIEAFRDLAERPNLICLDHDLFPDSPHEADPGDGRDAARFLVTCGIVSPVLIHSSNSNAAESMLLTLHDAGWTAERIAPLGEDWIEADWFPVADALAD